MVNMTLVCIYSWYLAGNLLRIYFLCLSWQEILLFIKDYNNYNMECSREIVSLLFFGYLLRWNYLFGNCSLYRSYLISLSHDYGYTFWPCYKQWSFLLQTLGANICTDPESSKLFSDGLVWLEYQLCCS